jgi:DNA repair photolyase
LPYCMIIRERPASSILNKSGIPGISWAINPYTGCLHSCVYCYASFMRRFTGHSEPWGRFLDVKVNAPELLEKTLRRKPVTGTVMLSSVTDAYQYAEAKYRVTRRLLEILLEHDAHVEILTKSDLVTRDIDLLKRSGKVSVGFSIMTSDDRVGKLFEPHAPLPSRRLAAIEKLKDSGISTWAFISPFLPGISDLETLLKRLQGIADETAIEAFNMRGACLAGVKRVMNRHYAGMLAGWEMQASDNRYWDHVELLGKSLARRNGISFSGLYRH